MVELAIAVAVEPGEAVVSGAVEGDEFVLAAYLAVAVGVDGEQALVGGDPARPLRGREGEVGRQRQDGRA